MAIGRLSGMFGDAYAASDAFYAELEKMPAGAADYIKAKKGASVRAGIYTAGGILLLLEILRKADVKYKKIKIKTDSYGRPYLSGVSGFDFNISHSGDFAVCAAQTGDGARIGIDIECKTYEESRYHEMATRFFSTAENRIIERSVDKKYDFLRIWTQKEALTKYRGGGLQEILGCLDTTVIAAEENIVFDEYRITDENDNDKLYIISLCRKFDTDPPVLFDEKAILK